MAFRPAVAGCSVCVRLDFQLRWPHIARRESEAQDTLFNAQPSLSATSARWCCMAGRMRYSSASLEIAWRELLAAAPAVIQTAAYRYDLADITRQVIANRVRVLLPLIRRAY